MSHCRRMHQTETAIDWSWLPVSQTVHHPQVYDVSFPRTINQCPLPFPGCPGSSCMWNILRSHFNRHHWGDRFRIMEYHLNPIPRCEFCESQVPAGSISNLHYTSEKCKQGGERHLRRKTLQRCFDASRVSFQINSETLPPPEAFLYLWRTITFNNSDWAAVYLNL